MTGTPLADDEEQVCEICEGVGAVDVETDPLDCDACGGTGLVATTQPAPAARVVALADLYSEMGSDGPSVTLRGMRERQAREDIELFERAKLLVADRASMRQVMEDVLVTHQRVGSRSCGCGDLPLGHSFPGHQAEMILAALSGGS